MLDVQHELLKSGTAVAGRKAQGLVCKHVTYARVMPCHSKCMSHSIITLQIVKHAYAGVHNAEKTRPATWRVYRC